MAFYVPYTDFVVRTRRAFHYTCKARGIPFRIAFIACLWRLRLDLILVGSNLQNQPTRSVFPFTMFRWPDLEGTHNPWNTFTQHLLLKMFIQRNTLICYWPNFIFQNRTTKRNQLICACVCVFFLFASKRLSSCLPIKSFPTSPTFHPCWSKRKSDIPKWHLADTAYARTSEEKTT